MFDLHCLKFYRTSKLRNPNKLFFNSKSSQRFLVAIGSIPASWVEKFGLFFTGEKLWLPYKLKSSYMRRSKPRIGISSKRPTFCKYAMALGTYQNFTVRTSFVVRETIIGPYQQTVPATIRQEAMFFYTRSKLIDSQLVKECYFSRRRSSFWIPHAVTLGEIRCRRSDKRRSITRP